MSPNMSGSEVNEDELDELLNRVKVVASKLTKIRACGDITTAKIATNNLWTLHWALKMLLQYMNQNNVYLMGVHVGGIELFANRTLEDEKEVELVHLLTLLKMKEENRG